MSVRAVPWRAAVFDLDGTLVDSETRSQQAWRMVLRARGIEPDEALIRSFVGHRASEVTAVLAARFPGLDAATLVEEKFATFSAPGLPPVTALPGAAELVRLISARGIGLGLVTSARRQHAERMLTRFKLRELMTVIVAAEDVTVGKPHPEGYLMACRALGVPVAECVAFEDSPVGVAAAKHAGLYCVAVATTHEPAELAAADEVVPNLTAVGWPGPPAATRGEPCAAPPVRGAGSPADPR